MVSVVKKRLRTRLRSLIAVGFSRIFWPSRVPSAVDSAACQVEAATWRSDSMPGKGVPAFHDSEGPQVFWFVPKGRDLHRV